MERQFIQKENESGFMHASAEQSAAQKGKCNKEKRYAMQ